MVVKFVSLSQACQDHCLSIIEALAENCNPREMFAAFMEVVNSHSKFLTSGSRLLCFERIRVVNLDSRWDSTTAGLEHVHCTSDFDLLHSSRTGTLFE